MDEKWREKIEKEIEEIKKKSFDTCMVQQSDKYELKELIRQAVEQGNDKIMRKLEEHEHRINALENQDGKKAILILKSVGATTLGWVVLGILNHVITIFGK
jgi:hypothetical protein